MIWIPAATPAEVFDGGAISSDEDEVDQVMISVRLLPRAAVWPELQLFPITAPKETEETLFGHPYHHGPATAAGGKFRGILTYRARNTAFNLLLVGRG
jgi:hypothetical protein